MNFVFLMDPLSSVIMEKDTSFALMLGAQERGHAVFFVTDGGVNLLNGKIYFQAQSIVAQKVPEQPFIRQRALELPAEEVNAVFVRSDPPFDYQYLLNTWLLDRLPSWIPAINSPAGLRSVNEKLWLTQFPSLTPRTLISRNRQDIIIFFNAEKKMIAKPTDNYGGFAVFLVEHNDPNANVILETLTAGWTREIIVQQYVPEARKGDKRILILDGEPLGAVLRVHAPDDHRNNFFSGGKPHACDITARDREIISVLRPHLARLGLYFVGIDILGDYLTEVNVTSPTCLQEMNRLYDLKLELKVIEFAERLVDRLRRESTIKA